uniref:Mitochondrial import inner membrane translocase subunit TIM50 n=1 Tax=Phallusia mammillata TaxID=59560 RepID=A0A6F9DVR7_9ASCI|nr:mitochondrial import inner membrane translocase subunit TIM50-like [Phallusia mammillata]
MATRLWTKGVLWKNCLKTNLGRECSQKDNHCSSFSSTPVQKSTVSFTKQTCRKGRTEQFEFSTLLDQVKPWFGSSALTFMPTRNLLSGISSENRLIFDNTIRSYSTENTREEEKPTILKEMFDANKEQSEEARIPTSENAEKADEKKEEESAFLKNQRYAKWFLLGSVVIVTPFFVLRNGQPKHDELGIEIKDEYSSMPVVLAYLRRAWSEMKMVKKDIVEPSSKKLLPDPLAEPYYQPPYTLVVELMDVFLRPVYDSVTGWRFKKRPGIDYFLSQVGMPMFEIVIFTRETGMTAYPLIDAMDSKGYIMYRLFRDAARYKSGFSVGNILQGEIPKLDPYYQKDLRYLNRDLSKVIIVDCDKRAFEKQPENGLCLEKWDGSTNDSTLFDLASFLTTIATNEVDDVRPVLKHYSTFSRPLEAFKQAQVRMQVKKFSSHFCSISYICNHFTCTIDLKTCIFELFLRRICD